MEGTVCIFLSSQAQQKHFWTYAVCIIHKPPKMQTFVQNLGQPWLNFFPVAVAVHILSIFLCWLCESSTTIKKRLREYGREADSLIVYHKKPSYLRRYNSWPKKVCKFLECKLLQAVLHFAEGDLGLLLWITWNSLSFVSPYLPSLLPWT